MSIMVASGYNVNVQNALTSIMATMCSNHKQMWMVEVKFKFLQNISHYCNNIFAFHMHVFTIFVLNLNKLNTTIHSYS